MGPIVLFDKSFVEMLSIDEATMFDMLFSTNICPIYYVEVLADLTKTAPEAARPRRSSPISSIRRQSCTATRTLPCSHLHE